MLELVNKNFNADISMFKDLQKQMVITMIQIRHLSSDLETIIKNQMKILELKNTMHEKFTGWAKQHTGNCKNKD